ncbi:MAG: type I DNA topoisomerase [Gemmatales bacterium]|nr:type I DNA topoisomerase [Gemmatales bacterium]
MGSRKKKNLVIVESPAKAKTISKYLGAEYEVAASKGHVRDLPRLRFGIDIAGGWKPTYQNLPERKEVLAELKKKADQAQLVFLAPDPDREGEAIAWHLKEALNLPEERVRRVTFNEITKKAVQQAFAQPGQINMDRVRAQETRRFLDRVVGYQLSPLLRKKVRGGLTAGRVQSVAVRLIVEREREIQAFRPEEYWKILAALRPLADGAHPVQPVIRLRKAKKEEEGEIEDTEAEAAPIQRGEAPEGTFLAELVEWQQTKPQIPNETEALRLAALLQQARYRVAQVEQRERADAPPPPFITSTLQQQANIRFRFSSEKTMRLAQQLYEGVELGPEGPVALITYMRTDSVRISEEALVAVRNFIRNQFGETYLPDKPNIYQSGKSAQEGHEAIRPTDLSYTPDKVAQWLTPDQLRLYSLIYWRFVASQMKPAIFDITTVTVEAMDPTSGIPQGLLKAQGRVLRFDGYRRVYQPVGKQEDALLPALTPSQPLDCVELLASQHFTQPPPRFTEASLVKTLEKEGIGRPSTYASIISKIQQRGYVEQKNRRFYATPLGMLVTDLLVEHFPKIMDVKFTCHMEEELDEIENGRADWRAVLDEFYEPFSQALKVAETKMPKIKGQEAQENCPLCGAPLVTRYSKAGEFLGCSRYPECRYMKGNHEDSEAEAASEITCPECGKPMLRKTSRRGDFLSCSGYPDCPVTMAFDAQGQPIVTTQKTAYTCEQCGAPMVLRLGKRGKFLSCSAWPKCRNAKAADEQGQPIETPDTGVDCEKCGSRMVIRRGPRGPFLGCSAYPKCRHAQPLPEHLKELAQTLFPKRSKPSVPDVPIEERCPVCNEPMKLRPGRNGQYFLGCSRYPKCRGTRDLPETLAQQLQSLATSNSS